MTQEAGVQAQLAEKNPRFSNPSLQLERCRLAFMGFLVIGWFSAAQSAAQDQQPNDGPSSIHGTVVNAVTNDPIARALAYTTDGRFAARTDSEGHFDYPLPKNVTDSAGLAGSEGLDRPQFVACCLQARKPGFLRDPDERLDGFITLGSEPKIRLIPEGLIIGRASLPSTDAAFGIEVDIYSRQLQEGMFRWVRSGSVQANLNGEFRFAELLPGEYKIVTHELMDTDLSTMLPGSQLYGFPPVYFPGAVDFSAATPIRLKSGQTFEADISPVRQPYYRVQIPVAEDVDNATVTVSIQGHRSPGYSLGYSKERHRIEGLLPDGTYTVSMETSAPNAASGTVSFSVAGAAAVGAKLVLARQSAIRLNVTEDFLSKDWNGGSASWTDGTHTYELHGPRLYLQASIEPMDDLSERGGRSIRPPTGPEDQSLVIEDLPPGRYQLRLTSSRGYVASASSDGVDLLQEPLVLVAGSNPTIDITMRDDFAAIEGVLRNAGAPPEATPRPGYSGLSMPPAFIYFVPLGDGTGQYQQLNIGPDGSRFEMQNVAPGNYLVLAFGKEQRTLPYRDIEAMQTYATKGQTVRLAAGQKERLELQIISSRE